MEVPVGSALVGVGSGVSVTVVVGPAAGVVESAGAVNVSVAAEPHLAGGRRTPPVPAAGPSA